MVQEGNCYKVDDPGLTPVGGWMEIFSFLLVQNGSGTHSAVYKTSPGSLPKVKMVEHRTTNLPLLTAEAANMWTLASASLKLS